MYINKFQYVNGKYVQQKAQYNRNYCKDCKHFSKNGEVCRLFTYSDIVNGNEVNVKAIDARKISYMCGQDGNSFQESEQYKLSKISQNYDKIMNNH